MKISLMAKPKEDSVNKLKTLLLLQKRDIQGFRKPCKLAVIVEGDPKTPSSRNFYTKVLGRALLLSRDYSTLPLIHVL